MKSRYRNSIAGFIWVTLSPVIVLTVQSFVFKNILKLNIEHYFFYLLSGLLPWILLTQGIEQATPIIFNQRELLKNFSFSPLILINSVLFDHLINMTFTLLVSLLLGFLIEGYLPITILLYPMAILGTLLGMWGISLLLSSVHIMFRDTRFLISFFHNILFFLTPIFYSINDVPDYARTFISFNPYFILIRPIRDILWDSSLSNFFEHLGFSLFVGGSFFLFSLFFISKFRNRIYARL